MSEPGKPLRILILVRKLDIGGAQRQALLLARGLAERGHGLAIAALYPGGALAEQTDPRVRIIDLGKSGRGDVFGFGLRLTALLRREKPDVLYSFLTVPNLLTLAAHTLHPRPLIIWGVRASAMEMERYDGLSQLTHSVEPLLAGAADLVIANAQQGAEDAAARGFPRRRIVVIPNGIDTEVFKPDPAKRAAARSGWGIGGEIVVGHAARNDPMKDHATFFEAMRQVRERRGDIRGVCVVQDDPESLRAVAGDVLVVDDEGDMAAAMNGFDLFCSSSAYGEAFSNAIAEALATGVPCIATHVGDAAELVGDAGAITPSRDPAAFATAILSTLTEYERDPEASRVRALARATLFTPRALAESTETHIREAWARRR